jgi:CRISPR system Cascade subunit CasC
MSRFIQVHTITVHGPSNLNRDDTGRPKTCIFGDVQRLRQSSQSQKRAWRTSTAFQEALEGHLSTRTRLFGEQIVDHLVANGIAQEKAVAAAARVAGIFGKLKGEKDAVRIEQLSFVSPEERDESLAIAERLAAGEKIEDKELSKVLGKTRKAVDIAMFGRMLADAPSNNVEAAVQVAHAITTHKALTEDDYYTAVDDLKTDEDDRGAGHVGVGEFGAGVFYGYVCIDRDLLERNLGGDTELALRAISALIQAIVESGPKAKRASFGSAVRPILVIVEKGKQQPRNLMAAFTQPVKGSAQDKSSVDALLSMRERMDRVYGACADEVVVANVLDGTGSLAEVIQFAAA